MVVEEKERKKMEKKQKKKKLCSSTDDSFVDRVKMYILCIACVKILYGKTIIFFKTVLVELTIAEGVPYASTDTVCEYVQ